MALTAEGAALTEAHRLAQVRLSATAVRDFLAVWRLLDPAALDSSFPDYARAAQVVIEARREQSVALSSAYLSAFREAEGVPSSVPLTIARAAELERERLLTALLVTGPVEIKRATRTGKPPERAAERGLVASAGAAKRLVLDGGRETLAETVRRDPAARGVARVTDGSPCSFCAMLASRGAVYAEDTAAFRAHDACGCTAEPVYGEDYSLPGRAQEFADLWTASTKGLTGNAARRAFRRAYEGAS